VCASAKRVIVSLAAATETGAARSTVITQA
jgi:hypothetical protein